MIMVILPFRCLLETCGADAFLQEFLLHQNNTISPTNFDVPISPPVILEPKEFSPGGEGL